MRVSRELQLTIISHNIVGNFRLFLLIMSEDECSKYANGDYKNKKYVDEIGVAVVVITITNVGERSTISVLAIVRFNFFSLTVCGRFWPAITSSKLDAIAATGCPLTPTLFASNNNRNWCWNTLSSNVRCNAWVIARIAHFYRVNDQTSLFG